MSKYRKFFVALGGLLTVAGAALSDGAVSSSEALAILSAAAAAVGVYLAPNAQ